MVLVNELKGILTITIKNHLDEQETLCSIRSTENRLNHELTNKDEYMEREKIHLNQLQIVQKLVETLSVAIETMRNTIDTSKFDKLKFQENLNDKLQKLEEEQEQQSKRLNSRVNTPIESPSFCSLESNSSLVNKSPKHLLNTEPPQSKFTLSEIRNIIMERNSLQNQVKYLEKQLFSFKKSQLNRQDASGRTNDETNGKADTKNDTFSTENFFKQFAETAKKDKKPQANGGNETKRKYLVTEPDDFLPVQGPINREPKEKLYPFRKSSSAFLKL